MKEKEVFHIGDKVLHTEAKEEGVVLHLDKELAVVNFPSFTASCQPWKLKKA